MTLDPQDSSPYEDAFLIRHATRALGDRWEEMACNSVTDRITAIQDELPVYIYAYYLSGNWKELEASLETLRLEYIEKFLVSEIDAIVSESEYAAREAYSDYLLDR